MEIFLSLLRGDKRIVCVTFGLFKILSKLQFVYSPLRLNTTCFKVQINHKYINLKFRYIGPGWQIIRYSGLFSNKLENEGKLSKAPNAKDAQASTFSISLILFPTLTKLGI